MRKYQTIEHYIPPKKVNCSYTSSDWNDCTPNNGNCGTGTQSRTHTITRQAANGGTSCPATTETRNCNVPCPILRGSSPTVPTTFPSCSSSPFNSVTGFVNDISPCYTESSFSYPFNNLVEAPCNTRGKNACKSGNVTSIKSCLVPCSEGISFTESEINEFRRFSLNRINTLRSSLNRNLPLLTENTSQRACVDRTSRLDHGNPDGSYHYSFKKGDTCGASAQNSTSLTWNLFNYAGSGSNNTNSDMARNAITAVITSMWNERKAVPGYTDANGTTESMDNNCRNNQNCLNNATGHYLTFVNRRYGSVAIGFYFKEDGGFYMNMNFYTSSSPPPPSPIHCQASAWVNSGDCSTECGPGKQNQTRTVTREQHGGNPCSSYNTTQKIDCNKGPCPVDCELSDWEQVGGCSATCGEGSLTERRRIITPAQHGGTPCPDQMLLNRYSRCGQNNPPCAQCWERIDGSEPKEWKSATSLDQSKCRYAFPFKREWSATQPVDCRVSDWNDWGNCSGGNKTRTRYVTQQKQGKGVGCPTLSQSTACSVGPGSGCHYRYGGGGWSKIDHYDQAACEAVAPNWAQYGIEAKWF